jgi:hypothetical protein
MAFLGIAQCEKERESCEIVKMLMGENLLFNKFERNFIL